MSGSNGSGMPARFNVNRRTSVSAESLHPSSLTATPTAALQTPLSHEQLQRLKATVRDNFLFKNLDDESLGLLLNALEEKRVPKGTHIIEQGDEGDFYYIVESGSVDFYRNGDKVGSAGPGSSFGELALMYNAPRAATVVATSDCVLWALERVTFKKTLLVKTSSQRNMYGEFLKSVPLLKGLSPYELSKLADALSTAVFQAGETVVREGETGEEFYLIEEGEALVTKGGEHVATLTKGDYFGEVALLHDSPRQATVTAQSRLKVVFLGKSAFQRLLGPVHDLLKRNDPTHQ